MCPAYEARIPAATNASLELCKNAMRVAESSEKTAGIRTKTMTRNRPNPSARKIPIGIIVMDKLIHVHESVRQMACLFEFVPVTRCSMFYNPVDRSVVASICREAERRVF